MGPLGFQELLLILVVAFFVLGPKRLPEAAATLGRAMRALRGAADDAKEAITREIPLDEKPVPPPPPGEERGPDAP
jgi:Tat protein translocase TatB subunit